MKRIFLLIEIRTGTSMSKGHVAEKFPYCWTVKDQRGSTPLIVSTYYDQEEITDLLLKMAPKLCQGRLRNTALMGVCFKRFIRMLPKG